MSLTPQQVYQITLQQGDVIIAPDYGPITQPTAHGTFWATSAATSYAGPGWKVPTNTGILLSSAGGVQLGDNASGLKVPPGRWKFDVQVVLTGLTSVFEQQTTLLVGGTPVLEYTRIRNGSANASAASSVCWTQFVTVNNEANVLPTMGTAGDHPGAQVQHYAMTATKLD